jgi:hypothetical protein
MNNTLLGICLGISLFLICHVNNVFDASNYDVTTVKGRIQYYCDLLVKLAPPYIWGGFWGGLGGDCSGQTNWVYQQAGVGVKRETARGMWLGRGGWGINNTVGVQPTLVKAQFPNPIFFNYSGKEDSHVGIKKTNDIFYEASSSAKVYKETAFKGRSKFLHGYKEVNLTPGA